MVSVTCPLLVNGIFGVWVFGLRGNEGHLVHSGSTTNGRAVEIQPWESLRFA